MELGPNIFFVNESRKKNQDGKFSTMLDSVNRQSIEL